MQRISLGAPLFMIMVILKFLGSNPVYAIQVSEQFNYTYQDKIDRSFEYFRGLPFEEKNYQNSELEFLLEKETPKQWLLERVQYILPSGHDKKLEYTLSKENYAYPNQLFTAPIRSESHVSSKKNAKSLMTNIGADLYEKGKHLSKLLSVNLKGHFSDLQELPIISPRVGLVSIAHDFFSEDLYISETGNREADLISMIAFLFHEARHSDGNGHELGFPHSTCPASSDYSGLKVCDQAYNGPYSISSMMLSEMRKDCVDCSETESEVLKLMYIDFQQRILNDNAMTLEKKEKINDLQNQVDLYSQQLYYKTKSESNRPSDKLQIERLENLIYTNQQKLKVLQNTKLLNHTYWSTTPETLTKVQSQE